MVYVSEGKLQDSRSPWRLSFIPEMFWGLVNFIMLFFQTMYDPNKTKMGNNYTTDYRPSDGRDGPPGPGPQRRMGGFRGGRGAPSPPPMGGGG